MGDGMSHWLCNVAEYIQGGNTESLSTDTHRFVDTQAAGYFYKEMQQYIGLYGFARVEKLANKKTGKLNLR